MRSLLAVTVMLVACGGGATRRAASRAPLPAAAPSASAPPAAAKLTACRARPSTVYGDEPVVFEVDGAPGAAPAELMLRNFAGEVASRSNVTLPGRWELGSLGSGDFSLHAAGSNVTCWVTVNRELSRASSSVR